METPARFYLCARCRLHVTICRRCDRGQIYCSPACAAHARHASVRAAGGRYQTSRRGRFAHAERQRRYRARQQKVTHQGSEPSGPNALLVPNPRVTPAITEGPASQPCGTVRCRFCGCLCPAFIRTGFLRHHRVPHSSERRGTHRGHSP